MKVFLNINRLYLVDVTAYGIAPGKGHLAGNTPNPAYLYESQFTDIGTSKPPTL